MNQESELNACNAYLIISLISCNLMISDPIAPVAVSASIGFVMADLDRWGREEE